MFSCLGQGTVCPPGSWSAARGSHWSARGCCYADGPMAHEGRAGSALPRAGFSPSGLFFFSPEEGPALSWGRARAGLPPPSTAPREVGAPVRLVPLLRVPSPSCLCTARGNSAGRAGCFIAFIYLFIPPGARACFMF